MEAEESSQRIQVWKKEGRSQQVVRFFFFVRKQFGMPQCLQRAKEKCMCNPQALVRGHSGV